MAALFLMKAERLFNYRVDNYDYKCSSEVFLMDRQGNVLFTILKRKMSFSRQWTGYRSDASQVKNLKPFFQVRKNYKLLGEDLSCQVTVHSNNGQTSCYRLESLTAKSSTFRVVNNQGKVVAEANRKELPTGMLLGDDVLNLVVEPCVDHSLITALAVVYGLIHYVL